MASGEQNSIGVKLEFDTKSMQRVPDEAKRMMARLEQVIADRPGGAFGGALSSMLGTGKGRENVQAYRKAQAELRAHYAQQVNDTRKFYEDMQRLRAKELADLKAQTSLSYQEILRVQKLEAEGPAMARRDRARAAQMIRGIRSEQAGSMADLDRVRAAGMPVEEHTRGLRGFLGGLETGAGITRFGARAFGAIVGYKLAQSGRAALSRDEQRYGLALRTGSVGDIYNTHGAFATRSSNLLTPDQDIAMRGQWAGIAGIGTRGEVGAAAGLGIGLGLGPEAGVQGAATLKRMGAVGDEKESRRFAALLGEAVVQAQMRGREGEMLHSVISMSESIMRTSLNAPNLRDTISLITRLAMTGEPGAKGELGMRILQSSSAAIQGIEYIPGIRGVGQNMVAQTARGILSRSGVGPFEAQSILDQGATAKVPGSDKLLMDEIIDKLNPRSEMMKLAVTGGFGLSADQGKAFYAMRGKRAGGLLSPEMEAEWMAHPERSGAYSAALAASGGNQTSALAAFKEISAGAPAGETKMSIMATAAEALDRAFRDTLIPAVDLVAQAFNSLAGVVGGANTGAKALEVAGGGALAWKAAKWGTKIGSKIPGVSTAATAVASVAGIPLAAGALAIGGALLAGGDTDPNIATWRSGQAAQKWFGSLDPQMKNHIIEQAKANGVPLSTAIATIWAESSGKMGAHPKNKDGSTDYGLMGLNDKYHKGAALTDPYANITEGMQQLGGNIKRYGEGNIGGAISAYNQGQGGYESRGYGTTAAYVQKVEGMAHVIVSIEQEGRKTKDVAVKVPMASTHSPGAEKGESGGNKFMNFAIDTYDSAAERAIRE